MKLPTKIPTIVGLFLVVTVVSLTIFLTEHTFRSSSQASESQQPTDIEFTNVTNTSFTVTWMTDAATTGTVLVSSAERSNRVYYDDRDTSGKLGKYTTHSISIRDAKANTTYIVKLLSNGRQYINNTKPFEVRTPNTLPLSSNTLEPAYGTIKTTNGLPAAGAIVYLKFEGGQKLSSITKSSGLWLIPLSQLRTEDFSGFLSTSERMTETILVQSAEGKISATTDPLNDSPVPDMTIGQTYDFRGQQVNKTTGKAVAIQATPVIKPIIPSPPMGGTVLGRATTPTSFKVALVTPKEGDALPTTLPMISGTGIPGKFVGIHVGIINPVGGSTKVKADGTWNFTPSKNLAPGKQSVTITTVDDKNKTVAITHIFQVMKSGTQVLGDATPSATLTTTLTLTPSPTSIASGTSTPTETVTEMPTPESTLTGEPIPTTGSTLPTIILLLVGIALFTTGIVAIKL